MSLETESGINLQNTYTPPEILYVGEEGAPLYLDVDENLLGQMFQELGMTPEQASNVRLKIFMQDVGYRNKLEAFLAGGIDKIKSPALGSAVTTVDRDGIHEMRLYPQRIIDFAKEGKKTFLDYSKKCNSENILAEAKLAEVNSYARHLFITRRLVPYLKDAGNERSTRFLDRIFPVVVENYIREVLAHEGQHLYEAKNDRFFRVKERLPFLVWLFSLNISYEFLKGNKENDLAAFGAAAFSIAVSWLTAIWVDGERRAEKIGAEFKRKGSYLDLVYLELNEWNNPK